MRLTVKMNSLIQNLRLEMLLVLALTTSVEMVSASQSAGPVTSKRIVMLELMRMFVDRRGMVQTPASMMKAGSRVRMGHDAS